MLTPQDPQRGFLRLILDQFDDKLSQLLVAVALISAAMAALQRDAHGVAEPVVISVVLLANAVIGAAQGLTAERAMASVSDMQTRTILVTRGGSPYVSVDVGELVPGDIVHLQSGDVVPCDVRLIDLGGGQLGVDESSLTGESATMYKSIDSTQGASHLLFAGTEVKLGKGVGVVLSTGDSTELGKINKQVAVAKMGKSMSKTPLTKQLNRFGDQLSIGVFFICMIIWISNVKNFGSSMFPSQAAGALYYLKLAVALGIAAVPEGLPSAITLCLSVGARRMADRNVLIRKLAAVETLGSCSVICTDKTGTLTTNKMVVEKLLSLSPVCKLKPSNDNSIETYGGSADGDTICVDDYEVIEMEASAVSPSALDIAAVCKATTLTKQVPLPGYPGEWRLSGEATDIALVQFANNLVGYSGEDNSKIRKLVNFDFDPIRKSSSVVVEILDADGKRGDSRKELLVKGGAEMLLNRCSHIQLHNPAESRSSVHKSGIDKPRLIPLTDELRRRLQKAISDLSLYGTTNLMENAGGAMRCIAIAKRRWTLGENEGNTTDYEAAESGLTFLGVCGITDPPRPESRTAISQCMQAGLKVIMITGDSADTATAVGRQVNLINGTAASRKESVISTPDFMAMTDGMQLEILKRKHNLIFYRARPLDKLHLVNVLQKKCGDIVAMTGDGVNDAPALHQADVGVAMGITGTEVSKGAADVVLSDDNFMSIVSAVAEGRNIYGNLKRCVHFLVSCNIAEILIVVTAMAKGFPDILQPLHVLWINAITDGLPALAMGLGKCDDSVLNEAPRSPKAPILDTGTFFRHLITGMYMALATNKVFSYWYSCYGINYKQLSNWNHCRQWPRFMHSYFAPNLPDEPCEIFKAPLKSIPQTMVLASIVSMELLKAFGTIFSSSGSVSQDGNVQKRKQLSVLSALKRNKILVITVITSFLVNYFLIQIPNLGKFLGLHPLKRQEWFVVMVSALPVIVLDWILQKLSNMLMMGHQA